MSGMRRPELNRAVECIAAAAMARHAQGSRCVGAASSNGRNLVAELAPWVASVAAQQFGAHHVGRIAAGRSHHGLRYR